MIASWVSVAGAIAISLDFPLSDEEGGGGCDMEREAFGEEDELDNVVDVDVAEPTNDESVESVLLFEVFASRPLLSLGRVTDLALIAEAR